MSKAFSALMPAHGTLLDVIAEQLAEEAQDFAGEQLAPRPATADPALALRGQPQLIAIALNNLDLALRIKAFLDCVEEGDYAGALGALDPVALKLRELSLDARADESGTVKT